MFLCLIQRNYDTYSFDQFMLFFQFSFNPSVKIFSGILKFPSMFSCQVYL